MKPTQITPNTLAVRMRRLLANEDFQLYQECLVDYREQFIAKAVKNGDKEDWRWLGGFKAAAEMAVKVALSAEKKAKEKRKESGDEE